MQRLASLGPEAAPALPGSRRNFAWQLSLMRKYNAFGSEGSEVARALGRIGPSAAAAVPDLRELIASTPPRTNTPVEMEAVRALGRIGPAAEKALPEVVKLLLKYPDPARRSNFGFEADRNPVIVRAVERIAAGKPEKLVPHLVKALKIPPRDRMEPELMVLAEDYFDRRIGVVEFIGRLGPHARAAAPALAPCSPNLVQRIPVTSTARSPRRIFGTCSARRPPSPCGTSPARPTTPWPLVATLNSPIDLGKPDAYSRRGLRGHVAARRPHHPRSGGARARADRRCRPSPRCRRCCGKSIKASTSTINSTRPRPFGDSRATPNRSCRCSAQFWRANWKAVAGPARTRRCPRGPLPS